MARVATAKWLQGHWFCAKRSRHKREHITGTARNNIRCMNKGFITVTLSFITLERRETQKVGQWEENSIVSYSEQEMIGVRPQWP